MPPTYDLQTSALNDTWLAGDQSLPLPVLPRLSAHRQPSPDAPRQPGAPCIRLVKDILRTGCWRIGADSEGAARWWTVTEEMLDQIEASFVAARAAGNEFNLCWGHGDPQTGQVDARDTLYPLDQVFREGDTLWASVYVDLETATELRKPGRRVSVRIVENWIDGKGNTFPLALVHVALVDQPVMNGQGPFINLANTSPAGRDEGERRGGPSATNGLPTLRPGATSLPQKGTREMTVTLEPTVDLINELFTECDSGLSIPEGTTEENFDEVLVMLRSMWDARRGTDPEEDPEGSNSGTSTKTRPAPNPESSAQPPADLANTVRQLEGQVHDLSQQLAQFRTEGARAAYTARLEALARAGRINARAVISLTQTGANHGYDLSLLAPFEELQMVDMHRRAKGLSTGNAPAIEGVTPELTQEQIEALAARVAGKK